MRQGLKEFVLRSDLIAVAAALLVALATLTLLENVVSGLITPLISIFVGDPVFELNSYSVGSSEFRYGMAISAAITLVLAAIVAYLVVVLAQRYRDQESAAAETRACPECTSSISALAKRCPHCTAVVAADV